MNLLDNLREQLKYRFLVGNYQFDITKVVPANYSIPKYPIGVENELHLHTNRRGSHRRFGLYCYRQSHCRFYHRSNKRMTRLPIPKAE